MEPITTGTTVSADTALVDTGRKRDAQGRRIITAGERAALLAAYAGSGLTQRAFARQEGLNYSTFTAWLQGRRRAAEVASPTAKVRFAEVRLPAAASHGLEIRLPDGLVLRGSHATELAALARALRS
jgi:transposase-like protein